MNLADQLENARAEVVRLERQAVSATCVELGHDWHSIGGCNAGCDPDYCGCSVPVNVCARCGDSDYGDNDEAEKIRAECKTLQAEDDVDEGFDAGEWNNT